MSVIRRSECPNHGTLSGSISIDVRDGHRFPRCGYCDVELVEMEYVPASQLQGAVKENERLRELLFDIEVSGALSGSSALLERVAEALLDGVGGQFDATVMPLPGPSNARVSAASAMRCAREHDPDISWGDLAEIAFQHAPLQGESPGA